MTTYVTVNALVYSDPTSGVDVTVTPQPEHEIGEKLGIVVPEHFTLMFRHDFSTDCSFQVTRTQLISIYVQMLQQMYDVIGTEATV